MEPGMSIQGAEFCSAGPALEREVFQMVQPKDMAEQPRRRPWQGEREEQRWEAQWQEFLRELDSSHVGWGKEPDPWEDSKAFLASFEQVAKACQWPREEWVSRLLPALSGEAQKAFGSLEARDREDYGKVKAAILHWQANQMETLRQDFRQFRSREVEDPREIYSQLQELCHRWLRPERHSKEQILELLIMEQFQAILPTELQSWIRAGGPEDCTQAMTIVDSFLLSQQGVQAEKQQGPLQEVCLGAWDAEGESLDPTQRQISEDARENGDGEIMLLVCTQEGLLVPSYELEEEEKIVAQLPEKCERFSGQDLGSGTKQCLRPTSSLPPERQEKIEAGQMEALMPLEETAVFLHHLPQDQGQRTKFWQVLPDSIGKIYSLGDEKGSQFKVENPSRGGNKPGDAEKPQGDMLVVAETEVEIHESKREWRRKSLQGQNEFQDLSEDFGVGCSQTHPEHQRKEEPLFSRYGRKYQRKSSFVMELTRGECDECSTSDENSDLDEPPRISTEEKSDKRLVRGSSPKGVDPIRNQNADMRERKYRCPICRNYFALQTFMRHLKDHSNQTSFTCSVCGKCFRRKHNVIRHLRLHTGEKPFRCPSCGISFYRTDDLKKHQRRHGRCLMNAPSVGKTTIAGVS